MHRITGVHSEKPEAAVRCRDRCGAGVETEEAAVQAGWTRLSISGWWRCGACDGALRRAAQIIGTEEQTADTLAPASRGALPKETATTIVAPAVKG